MYGIDFGTSNTVVTIRDARAGGSRVLDLGKDSSGEASGVLPSLLYFERDRRASVGHEAMDDYTEALLRFKGAGNLYSKFRFFQALKLALKDRWFEGTSIFGEYLPVESLAAIFLREVKRRADETILRESATDETIVRESATAGAAGGAAGRQPAGAPEGAPGGDGRLVLGRPVVLDPDPAVDALIQARFEKAARLAGFGEVSFVYEPVGAAVDALCGTERDRRPVLVFDFGGGTLDISLARSGDGGPRILATAGRDLGGYLLDEDISRSRITRHFGSEGRFRTMTGRELEMPRWITDQVASFYALPLADIAKTRLAVKDLMFDARAADKPKLRGLMEFLDRNLSFELFDRIDEAKIALSDADRARIEWAVRPFVAFSEDLARLDFEALIRPRVEAARALVLEALAKARLEPREVGRVVRVGGSSRVPAFVCMLESLFPGRVEEGKVFTSIASGLLEAEARGLVVGAQGPAA